MEPKSPVPAPVEDVVLVHGRTDDGQGLRVLRKQADVVSAGEVRPLEEGKAVHGELVSLRPRADAPYLLDVDVLHAPSEKGRRAGGPAQVSTEAYRAGWKSVFGARRPPATLN